LREAKATCLPAGRRGNLTPTIKMTNQNHTILVICGPTASGKTSLAISVAKSLISSSSPATAGLTPQHTVNLLSADSRQIYQGLDIVTGKDLPSSLSPKIHFFGLDLVQPDTIFNLSDYTQYARQVISDSLSQKIPLIIVGGTGLYLKALTSNLLTYQVPPNRKLRTVLEKLDLPSLQKKLLELNPSKYTSLNHSDLHNPRRLIRAIEISSSLPESGLQAPRHCQERKRPACRQAGVAISLHPETKLSFHWIGLRQDKEAQSASIRQRVLERLDAGAIDEVKKLIKKYPDKSLALFTSLGVREIIDYLHQKISRDKLVELWTSAEIDYARRQMVWFQKQPEIIWYDMSSRQNQKLVIKLAKIFI
jgi:tRNA dimethylallyltransferase